MFSWLFAVGRMLGFGTAGGLRPALTLAVISVLSLFDIPVVPKVHAPFGFLDRWYIVVILMGLAILESKFDNVPRLDRIQDRLILPWRIAGGALAGAATIDLGTAGLIAGLLVGAFAGWLGQAVKHASRSPSPSNRLAVTLVSLSEEMLALGSVVATALFAPLGYLVFGLAAWLGVRVRRRQRRKYRVATGSPLPPASAATPASAPASAATPASTPAPGRSATPASPPPPARAATPSSPPEPRDQKATDGQTRR